MYSKKDIERNLVEFNYFIDETTLSQFIKNWKIDAIYEDEDGVEFFDNLSISKLKKGISLKSQGYTNEQIIYHVNKLLPEKLGVKEAKTEIQNAKRGLEDIKIEGLATVSQSETATSSPLTVHNSQDFLSAFPSFSPSTGIGELKNVTLDITNQTLQMLADAVAQKITSDIKDKITADLTLQKDNQLLAKQVDELNNDNKLLAKRIQELEERKKQGFLNFLKRIFS